MIRANPRWFCVGFMQRRRCLPSLRSRSNREAQSSGRRASPNGLMAVDRALSVIELSAGLLDLTEV